LNAISGDLGAPIAIGEQLASWRHTVTRYRIELDCHAAHITSREHCGPASHEQRWFTLEEIAELPLNTTGRKLYRLLAERGGR